MLSKNIHWSTENYLKLFRSHLWNSLQVWGSYKHILSKIFLINIKHLKKKKSLHYFIFYFSLIHIRWDFNRNYALTLCYVMAQMSNYFFISSCWESFLTNFYVWITMWYCVVKFIEKSLNGYFLVTSLSLEIYSWALFCVSKKSCKLIMVWIKIYLNTLNNRRVYVIMEALKYFCIFYLFDWDILK